MLPYVVIASYHGGYVCTDGWVIIRMKTITGDYFQTLEINAIL